MFENVQNYVDLLCFLTFPGPQDLLKLERKPKQLVPDRGNNPNVGF